MFIEEGETKKVDIISEEKTSKVNVFNKFDKFKSEDEEKKEYKEKIVSIKRISKTTKGGRHIRFNVLVVVGNLKGNYGFAIKKSNEVLDAIKKASKSAKNNICKVYISKGETIAHEVIGKYGSTKVYLKSAPVGTGIIAGGPVRAILELIGFKNIISKVYGSRTSINVIRATHNAICILNNIYNVNKLRNNKLHKN